MIRLTGLWRSKDKAGAGEVLSGRVTPNLQLLILPNSHKQKASEPDFIAYLAEPTKESQGGAEQGALFETFSDRTGSKYG